MPNRWQTSQVIYRGGQAQQAHNYDAGFRALEFRRPVSLGGGKVLTDPDSGKPYMAATPLNRIPTKVTGGEHERMVRNVLTAYHSVPEHKVREAADWYHRAHEDAHNVGKAAGFHGDEAVSRGAGMLASLSPQVDWPHNVEEAKHLASSGYVSRSYGGFKASAMKAHRILEGEDPAEVLGHRKTRNFYENIKDPENSAFVTIDSHQHNLAVGWKHTWKSSVYGLRADTRYDVLKSATQDAAKKTGVPTTQMQAGAWVGWKGVNEGRAGTPYPTRER